MKVSLVVLFCIFKATQADFECQEITNKTATCRNVLKCEFDEAYEEKNGYTRYCRCKTVITELPLTDNTLKYDQFFKICSQHETRLQELWVNDAELEYIDDAIFEKYTNLRYVNLAGNQLILNFTEKARRLTQLDLSNNGISSVRGDVFANLKSLKMINLGHNRLNKVNFCFEKLGELEVIYLNNNQISSIDENEFDHLKKLRILDLSHNLLTSIDTQFCFYNLKKLLLNNNKLQNFKELQCRNGSSLDNFNFLDLSQNELQMIRPNTFAVAERIKILDISSNNISSIDPDNFQKLKKVQFLNLDNNSLTEKVISCDNLQNLEQINILCLSHNQISQIYNCTFSKLQNLSKLTLLANQLEKIPPSAFSTLTKLQELNLAQNKISEIPEGLFDNLQNLKKLNMSHNKLTKFDLNSLNNTSELTDFDIKHNGIKELDLRLLKDKLPALKTLDLDDHLIKCEEYSDVLQYFEENSVVLKSCDTSTGCCKNSSKFLIIVIVSVIVGILALIGLVSICKFGRRGRQGGINLMPIVQTVK